MERQGTYDFAILGDGLGALTTALLLGRQGERVIVIPEPIERGRQNRLLFGYETGGLVQGLLKRWGLPDDWLGQNSVESPRIELLSNEVTLALRDQLDRKALGSLGYELRGQAGERFLTALNGLEQDPSWLDRFHSEFILEMQNAHKGWRRYIAPSRNTSKLWARTLRKNLRAQVTSSTLRGLRQWERNSDRTPEEIRLLTEGVAMLMGPGRREARSLGNRLLETLLELYAIRRTPLARNRNEALIQQFKAVLKHQGIAFVDEREKVKLKRGEGGKWEGTLGDAKKNSQPISFENLVFAHSLSERSLEVFDETARKALESELMEEPSLYIEWSAKIRSDQLPFTDRTEMVYVDAGFPPIQISVYGSEDGIGLASGRSLLHARTLLSDLSRLPTHLGQLQMRFERVISRVIPLLDLKEAEEVQFKTERHRDFPFNSGVRTGHPRIFHVNPTSYPYLGEFGPFVAAIDLARKFARRRKRELRL